MQQDPVVALQHDRVTVHEHVEQQRQRGREPPAACHRVGHDAEHRDEQNEVAGLGVVHLLLEFREALGGPFSRQVQTGVERRERATSEKALHEPHAKKLVQPWVTLEGAELVVSPRQPWLEHAAHGSEPCHRHPHDQERERSARRSQ